MPTTGIYTLSLHDALPIYTASKLASAKGSRWMSPRTNRIRPAASAFPASANVSCRLSRFVRGDIQRLRSEEHTSELQSHSDLVCRLLLEKKKQKIKGIYII